MSALTKIENRINALSEAQRARFNQTCDSKIYDKRSLLLTTIQEEVADSLSEDVDELSDEDLEDLNTLLTDEKKLSARPC